MRGVYTISDTFSSFTTGNILEIKAPSTLVLELLEAHFEIQDPKAREDMDISMLRMTVPSTGGGAAITPQSTEEGGPASAATVKKCSVALTGATEGAVMHRRGYPVETGWHFTPTPEQRKRIKPSGAILFKMNSTVSSGLLIISVDYVEMG